MSKNESDVHVYIIIIMSAAQVSEQDYVCLSVFSSHSGKRQVHHYSQHNNDGQNENNHTSRHTCVQVYVCMRAILSGTRLLVKG